MLVIWPTSFTNGHTPATIALEAAQRRPFDHTRLSLLVLGQLLLFCSQLVLAQWAPTPLAICQTNSVFWVLVGWWRWDDG